MDLPEGWPTNEMSRALIDYCGIHFDVSPNRSEARQMIEAALAAAPTPPAPKNPWKDAVEFECEAVNVPFNEESPDDTLMRLMNHYEYMEQESPQS